MRQIVVISLVSLFLAGCSAFGVRSGYEQPGYEVVERFGEAVELRRYDVRLAAEATVGGAGTEGEEDSAFRLLFNYISGANEAAVEIAMTAPVETAEASAEIAMTAPVESARSADGSTRMRFFLPSAYDADTAPKPSDPRVSLITLPAQSQAVLRFTGFGGEAAVEEKTRELLAALEGSAWRPASEPVAMFYDPPWTIPFLRRNEVSVVVARSEQRG